MKIEIELAEVERLKTTIKEQACKITALEDKLSGMNEEFLRKRAVSLSEWLFDNYMECVFRGLGFSKRWNRGVSHISDQLFDRTARGWWNEGDRVKIEISAEVSNEFRHAFIFIGLNPDTLKPESEDIWKMMDTVKAETKVEAV